MQLLKNRTFLNTIWLVIEKVFNLGIGLVTVSIVARYLGSDGYGMLNYALSFIAFLAILSNLGMDNLNIKSIVQKEALEGTVLGTSILLRLMGSLTILFIVLSFIFLTDEIDSIQSYLLILISCTYLFKSLDVIEYWVQAYQNAKYSSMIRMYVLIISAILKVLVVTFDLGIIWLASVYVIESILVGVGLIYIYFKHRSRKSPWNFNISYAKRTLWASKYIFLSGILVTCYTQLDRILVGNIVSKTELGIYAAALAVSQLWIFIPMAVINSFKPVIMDLKVKNENLYYKKIQQLSSLLLVLNILCATAVFFSADIIIEIIYGSDFEGATNILAISVWSVVFSIFGTLRGIWLICEEKQQYILIFIGIGAIISIVLNIILIPRYGAIGAAITLVLTELFSNLIAPLLFKNTRAFTWIFLKAFILKDLR